MYRVGLPRFDVLLAAGVTQTRLAGAAHLSTSQMLDIINGIEA